MIRCEDQVFVLDSENTTYAFEVLKSGQLCHLYYGAKLDVFANLEALRHKANNINGCVCTYDDSDPNFTLDEYPLEYSGLGKGDLRQPAIDIIFADKTRTTDFLYDSYSIKKGNVIYSDLPYAKDENEAAETLTIVLKDRYHHVTIELSYSVFDYDCLIRSTKLINNEDDLTLLSLMSNQLDFATNDYRFIHFTGDWTNEMNMNDIVLKGGKYACESRGGSSSNRANPFVMLVGKHSDEDYGEAYGFNLFYSGNHSEVCDVDGHQKLRFLSGINPSTLFYTVKKNEVFEAPQALLTYSRQGLGGIRRNTHGFIKNHVLP